MYSFSTELGNFLTINLNKTHLFYSGIVFLSETEYMSFSFTFFPVICVRGQAAPGNGRSDPALFLRHLSCNPPEPVLRFLQNTRR